jgi:replication factor A1
MGRYILQINLMDHAGQMWITAFNEVAEQMMGISANDLHALKDEGNEVEFNKYFQTCVGKTFTFQMMAKQDTYQVRLLPLS